MVKNEKGITLIVLIVTIIVLLILAVVTISGAFKKEGAITNAQRSAKETAIADAQEKVETAIHEIALEHALDLSGPELALVIDAKLREFALNGSGNEHITYVYDYFEEAEPGETLNANAPLVLMAAQKSQSDYAVEYLSVAADSLSAIKYAKVKTIRNEDGLVIDYKIEGDFPKYGNDDDRVDQIAVDIVKRFMNKLKKQRTYRNSKPTLSILTITSNVVYGKNTGNTPDGRRGGEPFGPGANPLHGRDSNGAVAVLNTIAKLPYSHSEDGISYTFSITPSTLGKTEDARVNNLVSLLDGYFVQTGHHINVNVFDRDLLIDAMNHPEKYPQLTIRVSGYAVKFVSLTKEQQLDVINRTIHESL